MSIYKRGNVERYVHPQEDTLLAAMERLGGHKIGFSPQTEGCHAKLIRNPEMLDTLKVDGAGDRDRTDDIQLGKLLPNPRSTQNQALGTGQIGPNEALATLIEHDSEHKS